MNQECRTTSLLSFLEAENIRLRRTVMELSLDTMALREALSRQRSGERSMAANSAAGSPDRRPALRVVPIHDGDGRSAE
jgi:hypothetical protein